MSYGAYCKHCRHYAAHHRGDGKCLIYEMGHGGREMRDSCNCPGYEVEPGSDWSPGTELHVRVNTPALKRGR